jgi:hypothetical protein
MSEIGLTEQEAKIITDAIRHVKEMVEARTEQSSSARESAMYDLQDRCSDLTAYTG